MFGIDRKIAYAYKKYHSGLMWEGENIGLDFLKFSQSIPKYFVVLNIIEKTIINVIISFKIKNLEKNKEF